MKGPAAFLQDQREAILARLRQLDLRPELHFGDAGNMQAIPEASVHLVATSPPYPMIEMWDAQLSAATGLAPGDPAFYRASHDHLGRVWRECHRILVPGGLLAVNIGDATRTVGGAFRCFQNHVEITTRCEALGFHSLIPILWKKPTNKPNAFLGSGFLPPNGYVTLDCEYILLFRKGPPRKLPPKDPLRYASEMSKAERDRWFSQVWDVRGAAQDGTAAFPEEIPARLIRMFSLLGETVLDPFAGSGTTLRVAHRLGRKAVGFEVNSGLRERLLSTVPQEAPRPEAILDHLHSLYPEP
ncbi:MAG TPA: site-specific DNA-methyltransferase [Candidatus Thermoplasmatota archaeon]|nr:site-specific DNA-methyltransferase [Candidatus Thermoplasmatota archaeon]